MEGNKNKENITCSTSTSTKASANARSTKQKVTWARECCSTWKGFDDLTTLLRTIPYTTKSLPRVVSHPASTDTSSSSGGCDVYNISTNPSSHPQTAAVTTTTTGTITLL
mmetsp:Transcript_34156/g.82215  ORF Transcript_34156/g.82215 Transcript_34156/m.82215 type:complete len:110 (+) Transcript_34156:742-1071(+)